MKKKGKGKQGFASMTKEERSAIASRGGKRSHELGRAHKFTSGEAREAGRKGGRAAQASGKAYRFTTEKAREAGRKGGRKSKAKGDEQETKFSGAKK